MLRVLRIALIAIGALVVAVLTATAATVAALPAIADLFPLELTRVVLTDGRRQVEMQGMAHVAAPRFYREVAALVEARRKAGWLVFYEEVRSDVADPNRGIAAVLDRMGAAWTPDGGKHPYEIVSGLLGDGLVLQSNAAILGPPGPEVRNVDVTLSQLLALLPPQSEADRDDPSPDPPLDLAEARAAFDGLPAWVQERVRAAIRILLAASTTSGFAHESLPPALTVAREALVADAIRREPARDILVLYGQLHLDPIRQRLEAADANWRVARRSTARAF
ncbi:MAG TPA: hypothetical protein VD995_13080 [Azospirillum sp.]|nr:hypothetical protein [Azospirillum sp.]